MQATRMNETLAVGSQLWPEELGDLVAAGYRAVICNRPDGEEWGQDRLARACVDNQHLEPEALAEAVDRALESYVAGRPFIDDRTIVVARRVS